MEKPPDNGRAEARQGSDKEGEDGDDTLEELDVTGTGGGQNQVAALPRTTVSNVVLLQQPGVSSPGNWQTGYFGSQDRLTFVVTPNSSFGSSASSALGLQNFSSTSTQRFLIENVSPIASISSGGSGVFGSGQIPPQFLLQGNFAGHPAAYGPPQFGHPRDLQVAPSPAGPYPPGPEAYSSLPGYARHQPYAYQGPQRLPQSQGYPGFPPNAMGGVPPAYNYAGEMGEGPGVALNPEVNPAYQAGAFGPQAAHYPHAFWPPHHHHHPQPHPALPHHGQPYAPPPQGPTPQGPAQLFPGFQQPRTIRIDTQVDPKFLKLYFENDNHGGGKLDGEPVDLRSAEGYVLITFESAEVVCRVLSRPHCVRGENLRVSLHHETSAERERTVVVSGPPKLIEDVDYLGLYFTNNGASGGGPVDKIEYDSKDQVTRIVFKDASVARAVLGREHTLDDQKLVVGTSVPQKPLPLRKTAAPQPKKTMERRVLTNPARKPQQAGRIQQQGRSPTQTKQKASVTSTHGSPAVRTTAPLKGTKPTQAPTSPPVIQHPRARSEREVAVCVRGVDLWVTSHETLFMYFENVRRSGVDEVCCMVRDLKDQVVYIAVPTEEDAMKVFHRSHTLDDKQLDLSLGKMPALMTRYLAVRDLPRDITLGALRDFVQRRTGEAVDSAHETDGVVLLEFRRNIDLAQTQTTIRNQLLQGHTILADPLLVTNKVMVSGLPQALPLTRETLEEYLASFSVVTNTEVDLPSGKAVITFQNAQAAESFASKKPNFGVQPLETRLFFDSIGMKFQPNEEPVSSSPDLQGLVQQIQNQCSFQGRQKESIAQPQPADIRQQVHDGSCAASVSTSQAKISMQSTAGQMGGGRDSQSSDRQSQSLSTANSFVQTKMAAEPDIKTVIRASPAKQLYCQENNVGQEIISRGLRVHYSTDDDRVELEGKEKDVKEMQELLEMTLDLLQTESHTWDARLPLEILRSDTVHQTIREACNKQGLQGNGAIAFTANGFEVAALDSRQQARDMRDTAAEMLLTKTVDTSGAVDADPEKAARWQQLVSSLRGQFEGQAVLRDGSYSQLLVMGLRGAVESIARRLGDFRSEHRQVQRQFPLPQPSAEPVFWEFFRQVQTPLVRDRDIEVRDGQVCAQGNPDVVQAAEKIAKDFERKLVSTKKVIREPSIQRLMQTHGWTSNCKNLESQHKCVIVAEDDRDWPAFYPAAPLSPPPDAVFSPFFGNLMARSVQRGPSSQTAGAGASVALKPKIHLHERADITKDEHQLLVNSTQCNLNLNTGRVSRALLLAGGPRLQQDCYAKYPAGIQEGDVAITHGGDLYCRMLAHVVLPDTRDPEQMKKAVKTNVTKCLQKAEEHGLDSVAFPAIGTGTLQYPPALVAKAMYEATMAYGRHNPGTKIDDVSFVLLTEDTHNHGPFHAEHSQYLNLLSASATVRDDDEQNLFLTLINPNAQGVRSFDYFSRTKETATFRILALDQSSADAAFAELEKFYRDSVKTPSYDTRHLDQWDNLQLDTLRNACRQVKVDVILNYNLNRIDLRGFLSDLDRVQIHDIIKEGEDGVHERQNALMMSKQVQWSRIDIDITGEVLTPYDMIKNFRIEDAYRKLAPTLMMGATYIDFAKWKELPETKGDPNNPPVAIHRHSITEEIAFEKPQHWKDMGNNMLDLIQLPANSPEFERVETAFRQSVKHPSTRVVKIERVQNVTLHQQYMALRAEMMRTDRDCERKNLWHGTKEKCVDGIIRFGFNRSYSTDKKRSAFGQGVYFATDASYSCHNQYAKKDSQGQRRLFLCKVLVGRYIKGRKDMRIPDYNVHDSAVDDVNKPTIFVIFKDVQAYPEYLIVCKDR